MPLGLLLLLALLVGCDAVTRYRVLSFFFDGVPPPPGITAPPEEEDDPFADRVPRRPTTRPTTGPGSQELPFAYLHAPFERRQCTECHSREASFSAESAGTTCRKCHMDHYNLGPRDWAHAPVAAGRCSLCHLAHRAQYPGLLVRPERDICFSCHDGPAVLAAKHHQGIADQPCFKCHDPHLAGNTLLIADSGSYERRRNRMPLLGVAHTGWQRTECAACHLSERSFSLTPNVDGKCVSCHGTGQTPPTATTLATQPAISAASLRSSGAAPLRSTSTRPAGPAPSAPPSRPPPRLEPAPPGTKIHKAVTDGKCSACHTAHKSPMPSLIKPAAEQLCIGCHPVEKLPQDHPRMVRAECLMCHQGHSSSRPHLLREVGKPFLLPTLESIFRPGGRPATMPATQPASQPTAPPPAGAAAAPEKGTFCFSAGIGPSSSRVSLESGGKAECPLFPRGSWP